MARPASIALAGFFPTPSRQLPALASLVEFLPGNYRRQILLDPCAADGSAILTLRDLWFERPAEDSELYAVELEDLRAATLAGRLIKGVDTAIHADAFHLLIEPSDGASLLYLNPPYDTDRLHGRLEQRFLDRWTQALEPGQGILMFVVPVPALAASASYLARHYQDLRAWRFPAPDFDTYKQCALVARRRESPLPDNPLDQRRVERWASDPSTLPELRQLSRAPYRIDTQRAGLRLQQIPLDLDGLLAGFRPWNRSPLMGLDRGIGDMIGATFPVAQPPRPAHIALALSVGALNGKILTPNVPGLPDLLVKGSFKRRFKPVEERFDDEGNKTGSVEVQRPYLSITVLRLDTLQFLTLKPGSQPSGAADLAHFNTADLVDHYRDSLGRLVRAQFPALHDPSNPSHRIELPALARQPFRIQHDAISTALKLLCTGENPQIVAEVGTGKSTVALSVGAALSPEHFKKTTSELERVGFDTSSLTPVTRTLIVCPPHLLGSWCDQISAVLPGTRALVVRKISDLHQEAHFYVLSREDAKLGHGFRGVRMPASPLRRSRLPGPRCPRCGSSVRIRLAGNWTTPTPAQLAETRARCTHVDRFPLNEEARIAEDLAAALVRSFPFDPLVRSLVSRHPILTIGLPPLPDEDPADDEVKGYHDEPDEVDETFAPEDLTAAPSQPLKPERVASAAQALCQLALRRPILPEDLLDAIHTLCLAAGIHSDAAELFERHAAEINRSSTPDRSLRYPDALRTLSRRLREPASDVPPALVLSALTFLCSAGRWEETPPCGEPLYQATPEPRRFPLARYILRYCRRRFQFLIPDEWHEYSTKGSAQQRAAHRLVELPGVRSIALTGSLMGGLARSLFINMWALSPRFRQEFGIDDQQAFIDAYGYRRIFRPVNDQDDLTSEIVGFGAVSDRVETRDAPAVRQLGEAPGIMPSFILTHLLPVAVFMHKEDLDRELPRCNEQAIPIPFACGDPRADQLSDEFHKLLFDLIQRIKADRFTELCGKLWGAMSEVGSYPDRCTTDLEPFLLRYPADVGGAIVAAPTMFPSSWVTPKERWIIERVGAAIADKRNVLVFLRHTGGDKKRNLPSRYVRLFENYLGYRTVYLDVNKVKAAVREDWLNQHVIRPRRRICVTNARAVQTGLNNLVHFTVALWPEGLDFDARVVRQANGRIHRIGQTRDVEVSIPYYAHTVQQTAFHHVVRKLTASFQVDGLSLQAALESAGADDEVADSAAAALSMGQAIYEAWAS